MLDDEYDFNISESDEIHLIYLENQIIAFFAGKREAETYSLDAMFIMDIVGVSEKEVFTFLSDGDIKEIKANDDILYTAK